jgi:DNA modification methylase
MGHELKHISEIRPNPYIDEFYGEFSFQNQDNILLYNDIAENGILEDIKITKNGLIISGNRRYYCAKKCVNISKIPVEIIDIEDEDVSENLIVSYQLHRTKTIIQVAKEYEIIGKKFKIRQGKGNEIQNKEGTGKRIELLSNTKHKRTSLEKVITSHKMLLNLDSKLDEESAWKELENLYKSKSVDGAVIYLKNVVGEKKNEEKSKDIKLNSYDSFKIYNMSCENLSDIIEDKTIDCICSSPPYPNSIRTYSEDGKNIKKGTKKNELKQLGQENTIEEYIEKMVTYVRECVRTLKPTGSIWINIMDVRKDGNYLNVPEKLLLAIEKEGLITAQKCIWFKNNPPFDNNKGFQQSMEHIFHFVKDAKEYKWVNNWFNKADEFLGKITYGGDSKKSEKRNEEKERKFRNVFFYQTNKDDRNNNDGVGIANSVIKTDVNNTSYIKSMLNSHGFALQHNALYDLEIPMICILSTTEKGDSVMDIFSGLATTGLIAYANECKYIGIEQSGVYSAQSIVRFEDFLLKNPNIKRLDN